MNSPQTAPHPVRKEVLSNTLTIVTETMPHVRSVSIGVWLDLGSRDEEAGKNGIFHFIEHLLFRCRLLYHEGHVRFLETLARPTFKHAVKRFSDWDVIEFFSPSPKNHSDKRPAKRLRLTTSCLEQNAHITLSKRLHTLVHGQPSPAVSPPQDVLKMGA